MNFNQKWIALGAFVLTSGWANAQFSLFVAESVSGSLGGNTAAYGGVRQYSFANHGSAQVAGAGIAAANLSDPVGLRMYGDTLYVANRHGNTQGLGSLQAFTWDGTNLTGGATLFTQSSPSFQGFHGFDMAPNGDFYQTTVSGGTRQYHDAGSGYTDIGGFSSGAVRDALVSPDGKRLFETTTGNILRVTDLITNTTTNFTVNGANSMHQMQLVNGNLYITGFNSNTVHKVVLDANFDPTSSSIILQVPTAIGIAFSNDNLEMFVSGHTSNTISRFLWDGSSWQTNGSFDVGQNLGYLATNPVPEPATMTILGAGALSLLARRRKSKR